MPDIEKPEIEILKSFEAPVGAIPERPIDTPRDLPLDELVVVAEEAYRRLPEKFRALCDGLVIHVEDFPTDEVLDTMGAETEFDLLGLFQGIGQIGRAHV